MRTQRNPPVMAVVGPILPYAIIGGAIYFFWDKILLTVGSKLTGKSVEEYKSAAETTKQAILVPVATVKDIFKYATGKQGNVATSVKGKDIKVPFPSPQSPAEFRANIDAINKALGKV